MQRPMVDVTWLVRADEVRPEDWAGVTNSLCDWIRLQLPDGVDGNLMDSITT
jgi:hypothetical protein